MGWYVFKCVKMIVLFEMNYIYEIGILKEKSYEVMECYDGVFCI